jgi:hypothetical protein
MNLAGRRKDEDTGADAVFPALGEKPTLPLLDDPHVVARVSVGMDLLPWLEAPHRDPAMAPFRHGYLGGSFGREGDDIGEAAKDHGPHLPG